MGKRKTRSVLQSARADGDGMKKAPWVLSYAQFRSFKKLLMSKASSDCRVISVFCNP